VTARRWLPSRLERLDDGTYSPRPGRKRALHATGDALWDAADRKAGAVHAAALKAQADAGGLRFEPYLPPDMAVWLLGLIERGSFMDPSEAVFVMLGEQQEPSPIPICGVSC
jgi:hypothetical protein